MNLKLDKTHLENMADRLCQEIDACEGSKSGLIDRIAKTRALYNVEKAQSTLNIVEGIEPYALPLYRSKIDRVKDSVVKTFTAVFPYVQVIAENSEDPMQNTNDDNYERCLMCLAENSGFKRSLARAFVEACNTDLGIIRLRPIYGKDGLLAKLESERIKLEFMVGFPAYVSTFEECTTVGHRFMLPMRDIKRKQKEKVYLDAELTPTSAQEFLDANVSYQLTSAETPTASDPEYDMTPVKLYELITLEKVGGEWKKVLVTLAYDTRSILSVQDYPYPKDWYIEIRLDDEGDTLIPDNSLGQRSQAINQAFSDGNFALFAGSLGAAFPVIATTGNIGNTKHLKTTLGTILTLPQGVTANVLGTAFNPGALPLALQKLEEMMDAVVGISRMGTGQSLPAETREAAINGLLQAQQDAKEGYADAVSPAVKKYFELLDLFFVSHFWDLKAIYGGKLPIEDPMEIPTTYRLEVTGQNSSSSPQNLMQKLTMLLQMASQPMSIFSPRKVEEKVGQTMELPFDVSGLRSDEKDALLRLIAQLEEMGMPNPTGAAIQLLMGLAQEMQNEATKTSGGVGGGNPGGKTNPSLAPPQATGPTG